VGLIRKFEETMPYLQNGIPEIGGMITILIDWPVIFDDRQMGAN
jgi:hypothetical protein